MKMKIGNENREWKERWRKIEKGDWEREKKEGGIEILVLKGLEWLRKEGLKLRNGGKMVMKGFKRGIGMYYKKLMDMDEIKKKRKEDFKRLELLIDYERIEKRKRKWWWGKEEDKEEENKKEKGGKKK